MKAVGVTQVTQNIQMKRMGALFQRSLPKQCRQYAWLNIKHVSSQVQSFLINLHGVVYVSYV